MNEEPNFKLVNSIFTMIHGEVDTALDQGTGAWIDRLAKIYFDSWKGLKYWSGTAAGWPWLGEYIIFYVVRREIEKRIGCKFLPVSKRKKGELKVEHSTHEISMDKLEVLSERVQPTKDIMKFIDSKSSQYVLAHNAAIGGVRPDITLFKGDKLLFTIDVKIGPPSGKALNEALGRLIHTVKDEGAKTQGYLISLSKDMGIKVETIRSKVNDFLKIDNCGFVAPANGTTKDKIEKLGHELMSLEECLGKIVKAL